MSENSRAERLSRDVRRIICECDDIDVLKFKVHCALDTDRFIHGSMQQWAATIRKHVQRHRLGEINTKYVMNEILVDCVHEPMNYAKINLTFEHLVQTGHLKLKERDGRFMAVYKTTFAPKF